MMSVGMKMANAADWITLHLSLQALATANPSALYVEWQYKDDGKEEGEVVEQRYLLNDGQSWLPHAFIEWVSEVRLNPVVVYMVSSQEGPHLPGYWLTREALSTYNFDGIIHDNHFMDVLD